MQRISRSEIKKKQIITILLISLLYITLLLLASFKDLQISIALYNRNSIFANFMEEMGDFPAYLCTALVFLILFQAITENNKYYLLQKIFLGLLTVIGFSIFTFSLFHKFYDDAIPYEFMYITFFTMVLSILSILGTNHIDKNLMKKLIIFALFSLIAFIISQSLIQVAKLIWSRLRFRNMNEAFDGFTRWYKINLTSVDREYLIISDFKHPDSDAFKSCPSGHVGSAALTFVIIMLPQLFDKLSKYHIWFWVGPSLFTISVMVSRIIIGAHFLSDTLVALAISLGSILIIYRIFLNRIRNR